MQPLKNNHVKQGISVHELKGEKNINLVKKITGDWAKTAKVYMEKYKGTAHDVAYDAEDMGLTITDLLSKAYVKENKITLLVARDSKKRIWGVALASFKKDEASPSLENMMVNPRIIKTFNKKSKISGVGTALVKDVAKRTLDKGEKTLYLHSLKSSESFYKKLGFINDPYNQGANSCTQAMKLEHKNVKRLAL